MAKRDRAKRTLDLIADGNYNTSRPDSKLIEELLEVVLYLNERIERLKKGSHE